VKVTVFMLSAILPALIERELPAVMATCTTVCTATGR
jgi:hypothetical protein